MIHATCHTADDARSVSFDAEPWFREADPESILHVAAQGWSSERVADALEQRPGYEELRALLAYARERLGAESLEDPAWATFTCTVDGTEALAWLSRSRPDIAAALQGKGDREGF